MDVKNLETRVKQNLKQNIVREQETIKKNRRGAAIPAGEVAGKDTSSGAMWKKSET